MDNKNIYVALRPRPLDASSSCIENMPLRIDMEQNAVWIHDNRYSFDHVFNTCDSNTLVYNELIPKSLKVLLEGFNFTILAYGQTGSGKSYTMGTHNVQIEEVNKDNVGIIPRILEDLFGAIKRKEEVEIAIKVSFMELYNDDIIDLLTEKFHPEKCQIGTYKIKNLTEKIINSTDEAMIALKEGTKRRKTASTEMNVASSRSHAIFFVFIEQRNRITSEKKYSKLQLIDLAGSERSAVSCTSGDRLKEGSHINKGLFELSNVIQALYLRKKHVPYRNSKLTQLLRDSFGGNSCTIMIACISLAPSSVAESVNTIRYASIARKVVNVPIVNSSKELREIQKLQKRIQELEAALEAKFTCSCQPIQNESAELSQLKANNLEDDKKESIQENKQLKVIDEMSQGNSKKYLQEIQNLDSNIQPCSSFQRMMESSDNKIAKLSQEIEDLRQYLDQKQSDPDLRKEMKNRCKNFEKVLCKTDKELQQIKANTEKTEVELTKARTRFNTFVKYMKKNVKQALYAKKILTEIKKGNEMAHDSAENNNSEYLKDWILKEIEQAVCEKIAHNKMETAQQEIFSIRNEIHKHNDEVEIQSLQKKLEFEQEKILMLKELPETESKVEILLDILNTKEDLKIALSTVLDMLIAKEVKFALNTDASQDVFFQQQEKENVMMKQNAKKLHDYDVEIKGLQAYITELKGTIKLQGEEIHVLKSALDVEHGKRIKTRQLSSGSMLGEYLAELEDETHDISSISSSYSDNQSQKSTIFNQSSLRKRPPDKKKRSLGSEGAEEVPKKKLVALSRSCPAKALDRRTDNNCIRHKESEVITLL